MIETGPLGLLVDFYNEVSGHKGYRALLRAIKYAEIGNSENVSGNA